MYMIRRKLHIIGAEPDGNTTFCGAGISHGLGGDAGT